MEPTLSIVMITAEELQQIKSTQQAILEELKALRTHSPTPGKERIATHITAMQFMNEVQIRRWKFNELIAGNKIKTIKKERKIYVPITEVARYFTDPIM
jgi:hypothetical protein